MAVRQPNPVEHAASKTAGTVDEWGQKIPAPNESFENRVVHPRNTDLEMRRQAARPLPKDEFRTLSDQSVALRKALILDGVPAKLHEIRALKKQYVQLSEALERARGAEAKAGIHAQLAAVYASGKTIENDLKPYREALARLRVLEDRKSQHIMARQRQLVEMDQNKDLEKEAERYWEIIVERLAQLGYKHEFKKGNKRVVDKIKLAECHQTPERIYYKLKISQKVMLGLFKIGFRTMLPYGVKAGDIIKEETTMELSLACQKRVTGTMTNNGAWLIVDRLDGHDGLLEYVTLADVLRHYPIDERRFLPIPFGVGTSRTIFWVHLAKYPHMLIGGSSGGGKSNLLNVLLCTLIRQHSPGELQLILVDLKEGLEFQNYEQIPHLLMHVVKDAESAAKVVSQLEALRAERAKTLAAARVRDIDEYNDRAALKGEKKMPRVVIIFDEYAAIKAKKQIEQSVGDAVLQIVNKGRACGIHLIICTQVTNVDVVPSLVKGNMNLRVSFALPTLANSMAILDTPEAAKLPATVRGRAILMAGALHWQIQTPHCRADPDIREALAAAEEWRDDAPMDEPALELPDAIDVTPLPKITEDELIALAISNYGGDLRGRRIWEDIKQTVDLSHPETLRMIERIVKRKTITYEGVTYRARRVKGNFYKLIETEPDDAA
jgi:hypothetical protein